MNPDFVIIGHIARDLLPDGSFRLGGSVTYAARIAQKLGAQVAVVTSAHKQDVDWFSSMLPNVAVAADFADETTVFHNTYSSQGRTQKLLARANTITAQSIPQAWQNAPITLLGPIVNEIDASVPQSLQSNNVAAAPQGWMRSWKSDGFVQLGEWRGAEHILPHVHTLILSAEDLSGSARAAELPEQWAAKVPLVIVTHGPQGAQIWGNGCKGYVSPAFPVREADPTGAGDTFAAALLLHLRKTQDIQRAAEFANAAASFVVESYDKSTAPDLDAILRRIQTAQDRTC